MIAPALRAFSSKAVQASLCLYAKGCIKFFTSWHAERIHASERISEKSYFDRNGFAIFKKVSDYGLLVIM